MRDHLDAVVLFERLGEDGLVLAMRPFDEIYRQPSAASPLAEVVERLAGAAPGDLAEIDLPSSEDRQHERHPELLAPSR